VISQLDVVSVYIVLGICLGGAVFGLPVTTLFLPEFVWRSYKINPYFVRLIFFGLFFTAIKSLMFFWLLYE
jgi:uncharacterized protein Usg